MSEEMKLTDKQVDAIANAVVLKMTPEPTVVPEPQQDVVYLDECAKAIDEEEMELIKCLPRGIVAYKGKGGTRVVNHTEESMNFLNDLRRNRKSYRTQYQVR